MVINSSSIDEICRHAITTYPEECCGIITGYSKGQKVHFCKNIQNQLHKDDPETHPRDARTAYAIDRHEAERIFSEAKDNQEDIVAFYHSHPEHQAYFSVEDVEAQTVFGEPEFPDALQIVVSVINKKIHDIKYFKWEKEERDFVSVLVNS